MEGQTVQHAPLFADESDATPPLTISSEFAPAGDQPTAISELITGLQGEDRDQVLLGVTGSGKTFTMAHVIATMNRPSLILAPNKTLAAQLYGEMKTLFPENAVEYFVSYYDYYQPEAYVPRSDTYIEKEATINEQIDRMRHSATRALLERRDVVIVASVSCIYGIGSVETYSSMVIRLVKGGTIDRQTLLRQMTELHYTRNDAGFQRGCFRVRGDVVEVFPAHLEDSAWRISLFGDEIETITAFDPLTGQKSAELESVRIFANSHYVTPKPTLQQASKQIKEELKHRLTELEGAGRLLEAQRLEQRTTFDLEMIEATGRCNGIENYSRYLSGRGQGEPPPTCSNICLKTHCCLSMKATSPCRRSAPCTKATGHANPPCRNMASACPPAWITGHSNLKNGKLSGLRQFMFLQPPVHGKWNRPAVFLSNRLSDPPAFLIRNVSSGRLKIRSMTLSPNAVMPPQQAAGC